MKTTVVHHSADFDGLFCREIARKFLPDADFIGWDFKDKPLDSSLLHSSKLVILDLPVDRVFGLQFKNGWVCRGDEQIQPIDRWDSSTITWIDHHKSSIETHPKDIPGYRIDGVAACRLAWQWFAQSVGHASKLCRWECVPDKHQFFDRTVKEPLAVRLAGEYDIWDKRDPDAELFQHGLRSRDLNETDWDCLLTVGHEQTVEDLLLNGKAIQYAKTKENEDIITNFGFTIQFEGLTFLVCNHARYNSFLFTAALKPEHDACLGFKWTGKNWSVSLYHAPGKEHHDLSLIAVKHGGGGHRGACGFVTDNLPFIASPK